MSLAYNKTMISGRMVNEPELVQTEKGKILARFSIAVNEYKAKTQFFSCIAFDRTAQFIEKNFHKGEAIFIEGRIDQYTYDDKNGAKRTAYTIIANEAKFVESANSKTIKEFDSEDQSSVDSEDPSSYEEIGENDDLPF